MKRILITGANSYVGTSFEKWMALHEVNNINKSCKIDTVDMKDEKWRERDFSGYDVVFHVAGIAHVDTGVFIYKSKKKLKKEKELYYKINRDLAIETAKKAKKDGVKQFIFMSSIIVYGERYTLTKPQYITKDTMPRPTNYYGMSKLLAEKGIQSLQSEEFKVVILRPPMIYGKGCKGNYPKLLKLARITPVFPDIENKRSMIYIDNLCEYVKLMIENKEKGVFFPQNEEYVGSVDLIKEIAKYNRKRNIGIIRCLNVFVWLLSLLPYTGTLVNKMFGSMLYDGMISLYKSEYRVIEFKKSIRITEG